MTTVADIVSRINQIAPFDISEPWDNSGLQVGNPDFRIDKIMIALDVTQPLVDEAAAKGVGLIITHHPLLFNPEKNIDFSRGAGKIIYHCARHDISIVSAHTNLDKAIAGLNDYFAQKLGLIITGNSLIKDHDDEDQPGIGRIAVLDAQISVRQLVEKVKKNLGLSYVRVTGDLGSMVQTIAICTGSGGSLIDAVIETGSNVYITGDVKYHEARTAQENEINLLDVGHFGSEHIAIDLLFERLSPALKKAGVETICYKKEKDPFTIV